jgi:hypothetical protein
MYCVGLHCCDDEARLTTERTVEANAWDGGEGVANCTLMRLWKWLFIYGCEYKYFSTETEFLN